MALLGSHANWCEANGFWYRGGGRAYFLNYRHSKFMVINKSVLEFIDTKMPWNYAAMSPREFLF